MDAGKAETLMLRGFGIYFASVALDHASSFLSLLWLARSAEAMGLPGVDAWDRMVSLVAQGKAKTLVLAMLYAAAALWFLRANPFLLGAGEAATSDGPTAPGA